MIYLYHKPVLMPKNYLLPVVLITALFSCSQPAEKETPSNTTVVVKDTAKPVPTPAPVPPITLKAHKLDGITLVQKGLLRKGKLLSTEAQRAMHIERLDQMPAPEFRYRLIDTLYNGPQGHVLLIGREYDNENKAWLVVYDPSGSITGQQDVYYDNAEGFMAITSVIKDKTITITTLNDFAEKEQDKKKVAIYTIDDSGKLQLTN
jgi:hypothetical protein